MTYHGAKCKIRSAQTPLNADYVVRNHLEHSIASYYLFIDEEITYHLNASSMRIMFGVSYNQTSLIINFGALRRAVFKYVYFVVEFTSSSLAKLPSSLSTRRQRT